MKIGVSINEVLRDFIGQFIYTYEKYMGETNIKDDQVTTLDLLDFFKFDSLNDLNKFLYLEASLEIFGHADLATENAMVYFNNFLMDIKDDEEHEIILVSKEIEKSIPSTFFFLSKTGCKIDKINFVKNGANEWDGVDLLITANPEALKNKPNNKVSLKILAPYNTNISSDYETNSLVDFIKDKDFINKVLNTKITTYEEI